MIKRRVKTFWKTIMLKGQIENPLGKDYIGAYEEVLFALFWSVVFFSSVMFAVAILKP